MNKFCIILILLSFLFCKEPGKAISIIATYEIWACDCPDMNWGITNFGTNETILLHYNTNEIQLDSDLLVPRNKFRLEGSFLVKKSGKIYHQLYPLWGDKVKVFIATNIIPLAPLARWSSLNDPVLVSVNQQIDDFINRHTPSQMGIYPIEERVKRIEYSEDKSVITCYDQNNKILVVLKDDNKGMYSGILRIPYHEAAFSGEDGGHSWGDVLLELKVEMDKPGR